MRSGFYSIQQRQDDDDVESIDNSDYNDEDYFNEIERVNRRLSQRNLLNQHINY
jgi:hypothetical protein